VTVNETRQARPPLATIICTYLIVTALVPPLRQDGPTTKPICNEQSHM
jgi:hypothetical protein